MVRNIKKIGIIICVMIVSIVLYPQVAIGAENDSGESDSGVTWEFDAETGTLEFNGTGKIEDNNSVYVSGSLPKYYDYVDDTKTIVINDGIETIGEAAFYNFNKTENLTMADSVKKISKWAFRGCKKLTNLTLSKKLTSIGDCAFADNDDMESLALPDTLKKMGSFNGCIGLEEVVVPDSVKAMSDEAFVNCFTLSSLKLPEGLKVIKKYDFANCIMLYKLAIPKSVTKIYMSAFAGSGLETIDIPKNVTEIKNGDYGREVFKKRSSGFGVRNLKSIVIRSKKINTIQKNSFSGLPSRVVIKVPKSKLTEYSELLYKSGMSKKNKVKAI